MFSRKVFVVILVLVGLVNIGLGVHGWFTRGPDFTHAFSFSVGSYIIGYALAYHVISLHYERALEKSLDLNVAFGVFMQELLKDEVDEEKLKKAMKNWLDAYEDFREYFCSNSKITQHY